MVSEDERIAALRRLLEERSLTPEDLKIFTPVGPADTSLSPIVTQKVTYKIAKKREME